MRLLHTADWHLGIRFHGYDRLHEQERFLGWLHEQVGIHGVDALLVSGDLFDALTPSAAAQRVLYRFLARVTRAYPSLQVVITAGNHDSGLRLEAADSILEGIGVHVRGVVPRTAAGGIDYARLLVPLRDAAGREYVCAAVPYLRVADCPNVADANPYLAFFQQLADVLRADPRPKLAMAHLYAVKADPASSARLRVGVGGVDGVPHEAFPVGLYRYVALGHIHRPQAVYGSEAVRYSGSPLGLSFGERNYSHGVCLVELRGEATEVELLRYESPVRLVELRGSVEEVLEQFGQFERRRADAWAPIASLEVMVEQPEPALRRMVEERAEGYYVRLGPMQVQLPVLAGQEEEDVLPGLRIDPLVVANLEYQRRYGVEMPPALQERLGEALAYQEAQSEC